jgi:hypothetical protein
LPDGKSEIFLQTGLDIKNHRALLICSSGKAADLPSEQAALNRLSKYRSGLFSKLELLKPAARLDAKKFAAGEHEKSQGGERGNGETIN